ncbi:MAG: ATP-binding cassette domain-containing protein, partial [Candidatus Nitrosocaldus sp.]
MDSGVVLRTENLSKIYNGGYVKVAALKNVNLTVKRGEFVTIIGPSGSGKSTLLNLLGALDRPTSGKVYIDGIDIYSYGDKELAIIRNRKIGF